MPELTLFELPTIYCASIASVSCSMLAKIGNSKKKKKEKEKYYL